MTSRSVRSTLLSGLALVLLAIGLAPGAAFAQVRMIAVDETAQTVTLRNFGASTNQNVASFFLCREPGTYRALSTLPIVGGGDLDLSPGEEVTVTYSFILSTGMGLGLYFNNSGFANPANMADYMQYKGVVGVRENVAVSAGLWTAGTFATGANGPFFYTGDGSQNGAAFWSSAPAPVPGLGGLGAALLVAVLGVAGSVRRRVA